MSNVTLPSYGRFCLHESWECSAEDYFSDSPSHRHTCVECDFSWSTASEYGKYQQLGKCGVCQVEDKFVTKDSGKREEYDSGMVRDTQDGKPRFDLLLPREVPYGDQFLTRVAGLLARGAEKYNDRNWEQASGNAELDRFKSSAFRHMMQWLNDESDEDHAAATVFNLLAYETIKWKMDHAGQEDV